MVYECSSGDISDLRSTLQCVQREFRIYTNFVDDVTACTWVEVLEQLNKAVAAARQLEDSRDRKPLRRVVRKIGGLSSILKPGVAALPDHLSLLQGGLAVVFSVSVLVRHSHCYRWTMSTKIDCSWLGIATRTGSGFSTLSKACRAPSSWHGERRLVSL